MKKRFSLTLMSTVLPGLLASCVDAPAQSYQPLQQVIVPEGCELEADGEVDCDGDSVKIKGGKGSQVSKTAAAVAGAVATRTANTVSSVSRGGLTSTARASGSSSGYGG